MDGVPAWNPLGRAVLLTFVVLIAGSAALRAGPSVPIAVLVSQDAAPYQEALEGFRRALSRQGVSAQLEVYPLRGEIAGADAALRGARDGRAQLILTLGALATRAAVRSVQEIPIVAGMVLTPEDLAGAPNATGVFLEFPVETELHWLQRILPGQRNVGVLFNPSENQERIDSAARVARGLGLTLQSRKVASPRDLPDALDSLANRADVLWSVPDQVVLTPQTVRPIMLFSLRNRIPFVGLSQTWVKAGALYALDRDYDDIGAQCGEMAAAILQGKPTRSLPPVPPRKVIYSINLKTARMLKLDIQQGLVQSARTVVE